MKLKSLFLCMLGAAVFVGCNNEIDGPANGQDVPGEVIEGLPIYATMTLNFSTDGKTYAGSTEIDASTDEQKVMDAAMYIYRVDNIGSVPQCAVYLTNATSKIITMKTTSGKKKFFVAVNPKSNPSGIEMTKTTGFNTVSINMDPALTFPVLNNVLYSTGGGAVVLTPVTPAKTKADGLIKNLAMNETYGNGGGSYPAGNSTYGMLMTNWDGPSDVAGSSVFTSNCERTLDADVDSITSLNHATNKVIIHVQRAFAKVSLKFKSTIEGNAATVPARPAGLSTKVITAAAGTTFEGKFYPWGSGANGYWSLGNIPTATLPFQQFASGSIRDMYSTFSNDSVNANTNTAAQFNTWTQRYDNTRVLPMASLSQYPVHNTAILSVSNVKTTMMTAGNYTNLTLGTALQSAYSYAYTTESAREAPVLKDHQSYVIVGGFYQPRNVITKVTRAAVSTNDPIFEYNNNGAEFSWIPNTNDTLYFVADDKVFIVGKLNLLGYYAWATSQAWDRGAGGNPPGGGTIDANTLSPSAFSQDVATAINNDIAADILASYFEGQCWYRIYMVNNSAVSQNDKVIVARNHIYDIQITALKGPGLDDPNNIIIPGEPVIEPDTYVTAEIQILKWHLVGQDAEGENK